jgi:hypothetical protein
MPGALWPPWGVGSGFWLDAQWQHLLFCARGFYERTSLFCLTMVPKHSRTFSAGRRTSLPQQLHHGATMDSTRTCHRDRGNRPSLGRRVVGFGSHFSLLSFAIVGIVCIGLSAACSIVDRPQTAYSFSSCYYHTGDNGEKVYGCSSASSPHNKIRLNSQVAWVAEV